LAVDAEHLDAIHEGLTVDDEGNLIVDGEDVAARYQQVYFSFTPITG